MLVKQVNWTCTWYIESVPHCLDWNDEECKYDILLTVNTKIPSKISTTH